MKLRGTRTWSAIVVLGIALAGCGGGEPEPSAAVIEIVDFSFGDPITVPVGQEVTVVNRDGFAHTWTADDGTFNSGSIDPDGEFRFTFAEAGEYTYFCGIHPTMTGSLTVEG
jgi:plastocyanin